MQNLRVVILGNSVGLRIRPPGKFPNNKNYGAILEELLQKKYPGQVVLIQNLCIGRATIWEILQKRNDILREFPDYYVINFGVSDASTREIPLWYSNIINNSKESLTKKFFSYFYVHIIKRIRPFIVKVRGKKAWVSKHNFKKYFDEIVRFLTKGTNAKFIILSINNPTKRIENELPGSREKYAEYNKIIKSISAKYNTQYIDTTDLTPNIHTPDGIHFSLEGHQVIAERIYELIRNEEKSRKIS